jgi:hypothetical protein
MEFTYLIPRIVLIAEKYSIVNQHLGKRFEALKSFLPQLEKIKAQERKWRDAKTLDEHERSRDSYVRTLIRTEQTYSRISVPGFEEVSQRLTSLFDKHGRDIADDRDTAETQRIYNLVEDVERNPEMLDALTALALIPAFNAMKESNIRFDELWQLRNKELSENERVDAKTIRTECGRAIVAFYEGIEYWASESDNTEWQQLMAELNQLGNYYDQQIKARITRRKNKEAGNEDEPTIMPEEN